MSGPAGEDALHITTDMIDDTVKEILPLENYGDDAQLTATRGETMESLNKQDY